MMQVRLALAVSFADPVRAADEVRDIEAAGLPFLHRFVELATAFHHAVRSEHQDLTAAIGRLLTDEDRMRVRGQPQAFRRRTGRSSPACLSPGC
ncbi:hypothetical protein ACLB9X_32230 [Streptomyces sp. 5K101]|uniref:hypothetical protein n=1 Tax=Streptomyces sp. 5K101 TaxID=3390037 RepID=UPI003976A7D5